MNQIYLDRLMNYLKQEYYLIEELKDISYGIQFYAYKNGTKNLIRVYENTKGAIKLDLSQIKDPSLTEYLSTFDPSGKRSNQSGSSNTANDELVSPPLIGTDEAGKGDYFGYLCIAAVYTSKEQYQQLQQHNIRDSKLLKDNKIEIAANSIKKICPNHSVIIISNEKFNELYEKMNNMNAIMGWAHAKAIQNVMEQVPCNKILIDKFGSEHWVRQHLKNTDTIIVQQTKAERNLAVAAASILARHAVVQSIKKMRSVYDIEFPLGASSQVDACGREFVLRYGQDSLNKVAKINFKNTIRIIK